MTILTRRDLLKSAAIAGALGLSHSGWLPAFAEDAVRNKKRKRSCILLWMSGGPSQLDTFDMKPGHANAGEFKPISTAATGVKISEHLPKLAKEMKACVPIRSMSTKEGDHSRATFLARTGHRPQGPVKFPTMGSLLSKELARGDGEKGSELPAYVSIGSYTGLAPTAFGPGFLGPQHAPLNVGGGNAFAGPGYQESQLKVRNLESPNDVDREREDARLELLRAFDSGFANVKPADFIASHSAALRKALKMMRSGAAEAFDLTKEKDELRNAYGRNLFGQGCLLARRLVERGVPFVEVALNGVSGSGAFGWDTHTQNFRAVRQLSRTLDPAWATLLSDLKQRGLLDSTLIVWMGEFGRTPKINRSVGRDHFPAAWSTVLCGGGVKGGQTYGKTTADGMKVADNPTSISDLIATIAKALGIDPMKQNMSNVGRPIRIADPEAKAIKEVLS